MAKERNDVIQDISYWKMAISNVDNIPLNSNHTYVDENNIYERLTEYVKDWAESIFGVYTKNDGSLVNLSEDEKSSECKAIEQDFGAKLSPLTSDWYQIALKGAKTGATLPRIGDGEVSDDMKNTVKDTFFPAYRALRDSFSKRWWFEYFFNHKQYVAERDALKVVTNLITSMTGYTKKELNTEYVQYRNDIKDEEIANSTVASREVDLYDVKEAEELFKDEKVVSRSIKVEKRGKIERVEEVQDELFADVKRIDDRFEEVMPNDEVLDIDYDEEIEDNLPAEEKIEKYKNKEDIDDMCVKFLNELKTNPDNEDDIWRALHIYMYEPMHNTAKRFCSVYDSIKSAYQGDKLKEEFAKLAKNSSKHLFETAFKALGEEDSREIVTTVKGKEVKEKVGGSLFGINTLKDRIVSAQKITNVMLSYRTPVGFYKEKSSGEFEKSYHLLENTDTVVNYIKANFANKYSESEINTAIKLAKNEFNVKYRGEKQITSGLFEIGYRPDPSKIFAEQKALGNAQKMIKEGFIKDDTIKAIVRANVSKWKTVSDMLKKGSTLKLKDVEKKWIDSDNKLAEEHKNYDADATEVTVEKAIEQYKAQKQVNEQLKADLKEPASQVVPPVKSNPSPVKQPNPEK